MEILFVILRTTNNMKKIEITSNQGKIASYAKAISHPTRVAIMFFLANREEDCYFSDIHDVLNIAKPTLSQHLNELKKTGLVLNEVRAPKVRYYINRSEWDEMRHLFADLFNICGCEREKCECECCS